MGSEYQRRTITPKCAELIAIDTNVLLRYILQVDIAQAEKDGKVINDNPVLISNVELVETL